MPVPFIALASVGLKECACRRMALSAEVPCQDRPIEGDCQLAIGSEREITLAEINHRERTAFGAICFPHSFTEPKCVCVYTCTVSVPQSVYMFVCLFVSVHESILLCAYVCFFLCACPSVSEYTSAYVCVCFNLPLTLSLHLCLCLCLIVYASLCLCVYIYVSKFSCLVISVVVFISP